jgi:hemolysin activation/secretion protein
VAGATAAQADPTKNHDKNQNKNQNKNYECNQLVGVNVVSCNEVNVGDVKIEIEGNRVLTDNEIEILENNLNNTDVNVEDIEAVVIKTYKSFNPSIDITKNDISVCILAVCK